VPFGLPGSVVYSETLGDPLGLEIRQSEALLSPSPEQLSSAKRSPLSGSIEISAGQVSPDATVP